MNLAKKKKLAERTFGVGKNRIIFLKSRHEDIKDAITKQDIRDLYKDGAIIIKERKGRKKAKERRKKSAGNVRKKVKKRKQQYVILTRKLREYISELKKQGKISNKDVEDLRKKIRNRAFRSKAHLKEYFEGMAK
jgi:large subunit ribosomal protein L19e